MEDPQLIGTAGPQLDDSVEPYDDPLEHLHDELRWLGLVLLREVVRFRAAHPEPDSPEGFQGTYIADAAVDRLLLDALGDRGLAAERPGDVEIEDLTRAAALARATIARRLATSARAEAVLPLERLASRFALTAVDRAILVVACAPDLDRHHETIYAYLHDDLRMRRASPALALSLCAGSHEDHWRLRSRLAPDGALVRGGLVRLEGDGPFLSRSLRCDDRVVDELLDAPDRLDARLRPFASLRSPRRWPWRLARSHELEGRLAALGRIWAGRALRADTSVHPIAVIETARGSGLDDAALALASQLGRPLLTFDLEPMLAVEARAEEVVETLRREAILHGAVLALRDCDELARDGDGVRAARAAVGRLLREAPIPVVVLADDPAELARLLPGLSVLRIELPPSTARERRRLWNEALEREGLRANAQDVQGVARTFVLSPGQVERAAAGAGHHASIPEDGRWVTIDDLRTAARAESHQGLAALAQKIDPLYGWDDIVLPPATLRQLHEIADAVEYRPVVFGDWGFAGKLSRGKGLNVIFSGASGTGKTMAAEVIARELGLDLFQIDLATVISKYIGETEKNLKRIFREAEASNAIMFFDEADALFGKRSEVRDSHDRYANIEISYLLQLMEQYEGGGMAILATNLSKNVDDAFARRMNYAVEFPFPDARLREQIWARVLPARTPVADDVDVAYLAKQFELAGGNIRGAALGAAMLAAADGRVVRMAHVMLAVARQYQKLGKLPSQGEFGPWYASVLEQLAGGD